MVMLSSSVNNEDIIYFVSIEETFEVIKRAHIATGHGGRDKMIKGTSKKYIY